MNTGALTTFDQFLNAKQFSIVSPAEQSKFHVLIQFFYRIQQNREHSRFFSKKIGHIYFEIEKNALRPISIDTRPIELKKYRAII